MTRTIPLLSILKPSVFFYLVPVFAGVLFLVAVLSVRHRRRIVREKNEFFKSLFAGYGLLESSPWGRTYLHGKIRGYPVWFRWSYQRERTGKFAKPVVFMGVKLSGTEGLRIHLTARLSGDFAGTKEVSRPLGWDETADGFCIGKLPRTTAEEQLAVYARLTEGTKTLLREFAERGNGGVLYPQYENVLIGKERALVLVGGDETAFSCLDLQTKLPFGEGSTPRELSRFIESSLSLADTIRRDFSKGD